MSVAYGSVPLGTVCKLLNGRAYNKGELLAEGATPVLRVGNFFTNQNWYYSDLRLDHDKYCDNGDLLYAWSASFGPRIWDGGRVIYHYHIWKMLPDEARLDKRYLYHFLDWDKEQIKIAQGAGATMTHVTKGSMEARHIPLPPLEVQRRLVAILDEAFAAITTAAANAKENLANAQEFFRAGVDQRFKDVAWPRRPLIELTTVFNDGDWVESRDQSLEGIRLIQTGNVGHGYFKNRAEKARYISDATFKRLRCTEIFAGDCLVSRLPDPVGRACIIPETGERMITAVDCTIVRFRHDSLLSGLFCYYARSPTYAAQIAKLTTGATRLRISRSNLGTIRIPVPPVPEQAELLTKLHELAEQVQALEEIQRKKLEAFERLKQSLLRRAFSGDLTEQALLAA